MAEYFIIGADGNVSYGSDGEPESFNTAKAAGKRARALARSEPGETIVIAYAAHYVTCAVAEPVITAKRVTR